MAISEQIVMPLRWVGVVWKLKWNIVRLFAAIFVAAVIAGDTQARLGRLALAALPDFDYVGQSRALAVQGRFGEAITVIDSGLAAGEDSPQAHPGRVEVLSQLRTEVITQRDSVMRRLKSAGMGALSGRGSDLESLLGAVTADFFLVGDVRDLVLEGGKKVLDGEADDFVLLLSFVGVVTTLSPQIDWVPGVLKAAKRAGFLSQNVATAIKNAVKGRDSVKLTLIAEDVASIGRSVGPGGAIHALKYADSVEEISEVARFLAQVPDAAFILHVGGKNALVFSRGVRSVEATNSLLKAAAKKGPAGMRFLGTNAAKALVRPHWLVGIAKGVWKGNAAGLITRMIDRMGSAGWWALPLAAAWVFVELLLLTGRLAMRGRRKPTRQRAPVQAGVSHGPSDINADENTG